MNFDDLRPEDMVVPASYAIYVYENTNGDVVVAQERDTEGHFVMVPRRALEQVVAAMLKIRERGRE